MKSEKGPMLETDRLDELLEVPPPAQPVVVVEYRNRGVPSWVFFPLIFVVPTAALVVYHRMVVERYRVQAAQADSLLEREISQERASLPLVRNDPPPTTILPVPQPAGAPVAQPASLPSAGSGSAEISGSPTTVPSTDGDRSRPSGDSQPATTVIAGAEKPKPSTPGPAGPAVQPTAAGVPSGPVPAAGSVVAGEVSAPSQATPGLSSAPEKSPTIKMRSVLRNPFGDADPPKPPEPAGAAGSAVNAETLVNSPPTGSTNPFDLTAPDGPAVRDPQPATEKSPAPATALASGPSFEPAPLPTKEESERQIQEESARRVAELRAKSDAKSVELRTQRRDEQIKFHEELRDLIRTQGMKAGPDIEALVKRYGYESDPDRRARVDYFWRNSKKSQAEKVRVVRSLDMPEAVILDHLSNDIFRAAMGRNGPHESEVRACGSCARDPLSARHDPDRQAPGPDRDRGRPRGPIRTPRAQPDNLDPAVNHILA